MRYDNDHDRQNTTGRHALASQHEKKDKIVSMAALISNTWSSVFYTHCEHDLVAILVSVILLLSSLLC